MSILSSTDLRRVWPESPHIQPSSVDLHMGDSLLYWPRWIRRDPRIDQSDQWKSFPVLPAFLDAIDGVVDGPCWVLQPGIRYLAATRERITILPEHAGQIAARSSWGRDGLAVICGPAGFIDPGFSGTVTLELSVIGSELVVWPGAAVAQLIVHRLLSPCEQPYGHPDRLSKYQGQKAPTPSKMHLEAIIR